MNIRRQLKVVAIIAVRNEENYIGKCLSYLISQGIKVVVIDNDSEDETLKICRSFSAEDLLSIEKLPFEGSFDLTAQLRKKQEVRNRIEADWIIHHDADEIMQSCRSGETLYEGICRVDQLGFNAINFEEFVFLPESADKTYEGADYFEEMKHYYFFEPSKRRLIRAYKKEIEGDNIKFGGHRLPRDQVKLYRRNFVLRHYICLSLQAAREKYLNRKYSREELGKGWHRNRARISRHNLQIPSGQWLLKIQDADPRELIKTFPKRKHFWEWRTTPRPQIRPWVNLHSR